jgi:hypothetical protein
MPVVKIEPSTDHPIPYSTDEDKPATFMDEVAITSMTAELLEQLGAPLEVDEADFEREKIDAIASMRILDEGIDIPDCRRAYILAGQRSERQAIQRRGRILRKSSNKEKADLYDFIIIGPKLTDRELERLYVRELRRANLFAKDADNFEECSKALSKI